MTSRVSDLSLSQNSIQYLQANLSQIADLQNAGVDRARS